MEPRKITEETLAAFARQLGEEERSPATLEKYLREVRQFAAFLGGREVTRELAAAWREELSARQSPATVNGKPVEVQAAYDGLMGIPVQTGDNVIELRYLTPGLVPGAVVDIASVTLFAVWRIAARRRSMLRDGE